MTSLCKTLNDNKLFFTLKVQFRQFGQNGVGGFHPRVIQKAASVQLNCYPRYSIIENEASDAFFL